MHCGVWYNIPGLLLLWPIELWIQRKYNISLIPSPYRLYPMHETLRHVANFKFDPSLLMANKPSALYHRFNGDSNFNELWSNFNTWLTNTVLVRPSSLSSWSPICWSMDNSTADGGLQEGDLVYVLLLAKLELAAISSGSHTAQKTG